MTNPNTTEDWLNRILTAVYNYGYNKGSAEDIKERDITPANAERAILTHIAEVIIGPDDKVSEGWTAYGQGYIEGQNALRAELRQKLGITGNGEK